MFDDWPVTVTFVVFFVGATIRANATYWLGRGARRGGESTRAGRHLANPIVARAETVVARVGPPAVTLSFLTVGVQTALNFAAGVLRMPLWAYEIAVFFGALLWAALYTVIGVAVFEAWVGQAPWGWLALAAAGILLVVVGTRIARRRIQRAAPATHDASPS